MDNPELQMEENLGDAKLLDRSKSPVDLVKNEAMITT